MTKKVNAPTPGPWMGYATESGCDIHRRLSLGKGERIAHVIGDVPGFLGNANLIAAAPDLLAAARDFVALYDSVTDLVSAEIKAKVERARAAIAKAEGR